MKYFVIHSGIDLTDHVIPLIQQWVKYCDQKSRFILLRNGNPNSWLNDATAKIRQAEKVIYIIGRESAKSPNIQAELNIAIREKKPIYLYKIDDSYAVNKELVGYMTDLNAEVGETEGELVFYKHSCSVRELHTDDIEEVLKCDVNDILEDLPAKDYEDREKLLEQYKMYVKTSEDLVKRKQSVNSFYVTLNSVILSAIISVICATHELPFLGPVNVSWIISVLATFVGFIVCYSWISILNSYAILNSSKMQVIINIEQSLALNLFDTEWSFVTQKFGGKKYKSFSQKEKWIAQLFCLFYALICLFGIAMSIYNLVH